MEQFPKGSVSRKWYEKYLPFVAKSPEMQLEWLVDKLSKLKSSLDKEKTGLLTCEELKPYISLILGGDTGEKEAAATPVDDETMASLLASVSERDLLMMIECSDIYHIPKLFGLLGRISKEQAVLAMKKVPPLFEKTPVLVIDRVFHAIKGKSTELLESAAEDIIRSDEVPDGFNANYERFREIMMDEHILSLLYPKAN